MTPAEWKAAREVCRLAQVDSLLDWLHLSSDVEPATAKAALSTARKRLQAQQGNPKHRALSQAVITHFRRLEQVLADPRAYAAAVQADHAKGQLPLLDMGVDGVLADGTVTEEELTFLSATAIRLGVDPSVAFGRLRQRAQFRGVSLTPPGPPPRRTALEGPSHPLLPPGWWGDGMSVWLAAQIPSGARRLVEPVCGEGCTALTVLPLRPGLTYVGFDEEGTASRAEAAIESHGGMEAAAMPSPPDALPLEGGSVDVVAFVLHTPDAATLAEARRVAGKRGMQPGTPRVSFEGPVPALDGALWGLWRTANDTPPLPCVSASTYVVTHTTAGSRGALIQLLERRVGAIQRFAGLADGHPAVRRVQHALQAFGEGPDGVGSYEVPLVARVV
jgi:hypothetical protein